jgi:putative FmdB family regulatory protein
VPVYDYKCENSHVKEIKHEMDDAPRIYCHCGKPMKKQFGKPMISFNGEGFYSTDKND